MYNWLSGQKCILGFEKPKWQLNQFNNLTRSNHLYIPGYIDRKGISLEQALHRSNNKSRGREGKKPGCRMATIITIDID